MNRIFLLILTFILIISNLKASPSDTLHVITHNKTTVVTDPAKGVNTYKNWGAFLAPNVPIRKITMKVQFACPDSMRCAEWDYMDRISILRKGGQKGETLNYEIGRMLTPYGWSFSKNWKFDWEVDVTDFSLLLRDSVEIAYGHSGYESNKERGWAVTVDFEIIKGKPAMEPISIQKVYDGHFVYGDKNSPIDEALKPFPFTASPDAKLARLRILQTGHGMNDTDNCGEFCSKKRLVWCDGRLIDERSIWKKCGDNPLYPQAGTWVFDRANWCPGTLLQPDLLDIKVEPGTSHTVKVDMERYEIAKPTADEVISAYLIQYKKVSAVNDVALEDIIVPSSKSIYGRQNPAAANPQILVKNFGATEINSLTVNYGTLGFEKKQYLWKGNLASGATATISLPGRIESKPEGNRFWSEVVKPNGQKDAFQKDNKLTVAFKPAPKLSDSLIFYFMTNNQPEQNAYILYNSEGKVMKERKLGTLKANTIYRDTLKLAKGAYTLALIDTAGDGLEFWYKPQDGSGRTRLMNTKGELLKLFESDCGSGWTYNFSVEDQPDSVKNNQLLVGVYPSKTKDKTTLDYFSNKEEDVLVQLVKDNDVPLEEHRYQQLKEGFFTYDLGRYEKGTYYLKVLVNGQEKARKRVRVLK
ncbi:peptide-N-glycosidase [Solitalea longa]|uniref:Peptide-N-glycosidase n=1 Tax=Solitalea longa TaxID=2079460 RepID=A0A2S5A432_9SPHI|nr:peptide-N-glycosidase F-related protein [Solitalea longa]POY37338.1 peptide-N-glycosidase [Solitalea longa]